MSDEQSKIPTQAATTPAAGGLPQEAPITDSMLGGMFAAARTKPSSGPWQPPTPEELQCDFPQYEIRGILGRGGMGAVYKGWQRNLDRYVAIKILPPDLDDGISDFTERFKREAKAMAHLKHPGIVAVYDAGTTAGGLLYFIMECIEGTDVQRLITEHSRLAQGEALRITCAVCAALAYAHAHGVIHRDIKPSNIMIEADGDVKIADFGLAKSTSTDTTMLTMSNITMGTPDFMAPEAMQGVANVDHRADIYAVGVMLYQMLTGKVPRGKFEPPSRAVPGLDKRLDRIVDRALQPERVARYASAGEMGAALAPITRSLAKRAADPTPASRRKPVFVAAALGILAVLLYLAPWKRPASVAHPAHTAGSHVFTKPLGTPASATKDSPYVNTLGMKFVPVQGTKVLFAVWETRVKDYTEFAIANSVDDSWTRQDKDGVPVGREPDHPVCAMTWDEANAFCHWLTDSETGRGALPTGAKYRMPTDAEWSLAAGLAAETGATPADKSEKNGTDFPWGTGFPPTRKVGNYADETFHERFPKTPNKWLEDYTDGFATTAPVGSFAANRFGIFDLGGNAWEWCDDWYDTTRTTRVLRGAGWDIYGPGIQLSSHRSRRVPSNRDNNHGFRCVLDLSVRQ